MPWANQYRRNEESRRAILAAALELCSEVGFEAMRIEAVARRAGTGKQTIYRWWPSKGLLLLDAVTGAAQDSDTFPDTGDLHADLLAQMTVVAEQLSSPAARAVIMGLTAGAHHDPALAGRYLSDVVAPRRAACIARLRSAVEARELDPGTDLGLLVDQLYGPVYYRALVGLEPVGEDYLRRHLAVLLAASRPAPTVSTG